ncbi:MAG: CBS and ACT domain-containing protein [Desulfobacteraceae bacterium]|jgi:acetoin utilization protein AcuB
MLVMNWMSQPAITVDIDDFVEDAFGLINKHEIHMLPVMQNRQLVGIVTDSDIKNASASNTPSQKTGNGRSQFSGIEVKKIMTPDPVTIADDCTFEEAVEKLLVHNISGLTVVNQQHEVVGVITKSDLFQLILILTGFGKKGLQMGIELEDKPGRLKKITDIIRDYGGRISSILSTHERAVKGNRRLYVRVFDIDPPSLQHLKGVIRKEASLLYIVDHNGKTRETFSTAFDHNVQKKQAQFAKKGISADEC